MNVQIFVYNCVFQKKEKQHSQNLSHFENESTFWKWKHILEMKAHFEKEPHFENENICLEKLSVINPFSK